MKTNIALICLLPNYGKNVSKLLGEKLDMFYVDVDEMVEFDLGDVDHILQTLGDKDGRKYIRESETRVVKNVSSFENTIITINPMMMFSNRNLARVTKSSYVVYLQISPKFLAQRAQQSGDEINEKLLTMAFTERDKIYVQNSDIVMNCSTYKDIKAVKKLLSAIPKFFRKIEKERAK